MNTNKSPGPASSGLLSSWELGWLTGIIEGESCIDSYRNAAGSPVTRIRVKMTDRDVVEKVGRMFGRSVFLSEKATERTKGCWTTQVAGKDAKAVLREVYPNLSERRKEQCLSVL